METQELDDLKRRLEDLEWQIKRLGVIRLPGTKGTVGQVLTADGTGKAEWA